MLRYQFTLPRISLLQHDAGLPCHYMVPVYHACIPLHHATVLVSHAMVHRYGFTMPYTCLPQHGIRLPFCSTGLPHYRTSLPHLSFQSLHCLCGLHGDGTPCDSVCSVLPHSVSSVLPHNVSSVLPHSVTNPSRRVRHVPVLMQTLQNFMYTMLRDSNPMASKMSLVSTSVSLACVCGHIRTVVCLSVALLRMLLYSSSSSSKLY